VDADEVYGDGGSCGASALADERANMTGLMLADFECVHGKLEQEPCEECGR
jgi:hypothetical protein